MSQTIKIDFVSDVACPWCAVGLASLEKAIANIGKDVKVDLRFHPFELNPHMPVGGQDVAEHLHGKYGYSPEQLEKNQVRIFASGAAVGFAFHPKGRKRVYNTFNAHRLLHWAGTLGEDVEAQHRLKKELLATYFTLAVSLDEQDNLLDAIERARLDPERARQILATDEFAEQVRAAEHFYATAGISAVPAVIFNDKYLVEGAQSVERFESALKRYSQPETT